MSTAADPVTSVPGAMSQASGDAVAAANDRTRLALKALLWMVVLAPAVYFVARNVPRYILHFDAATYGPFWGYAAWLFPHVISGTVALFLGPLQFWTALRQRYVRLHRWSGRTYLLAVAVGVTMAASMLLRSQFNWGYRLGLAGLSLAWLGTSALALLAIRKGNVAQHREWMVRSYVVTFGFVAFRVIQDVVGKFWTVEFDVVIVVAAWGCWALPLLVTEFVLQGRKVLRAPRRALPALAK